jgi:hypothetical protein
MIALGSTLLVIAAVLIGLGAVTWPPGGLLFALPFLFLMPGVVLAVLGGILLFIGRLALRHPSAFGSVHGHLRGAPNAAAELGGVMPKPASVWRPMRPAAMDRSRSSCLRFDTPTAVVAEQVALARKWSVSS